MVRTIVIRVDVGATLGEHRRHVPVHVVHDRFGEEPARDARLIGDHHDGQARAIERADGVDRPRVELDALGAIEVSHFFDDRAVAIQKRRASRLVVGHSIRRVASSTRRHANPLHAPVIERTLAQHARPAPHGMGQDGHVARGSWLVASGLGALGTRGRAEHSSARRWAQTRR